MGRKSQKPGGKSKKADRCRDSASHKRYNAERRWMKHQINRVVRYMKRHPKWKIPEDMDEEVKTYVRVRLKQ